MPGIRARPQLTDGPPLPPALEYRYDLYSRAYDAFTSNLGANARLGFYSRAMRCRRAAEVITLAEGEVENGFPKRIEHVGSQYGSCSDCVRSACLAAEELITSESPERRIER